MRERDDSRASESTAPAAAAPNLSAALTEMYEALKARMILEDYHANCEECEGEGEPELCEKCFPLADDARLKMRAAMARIEGNVR